MKIHLTPDILEATYVLLCLTLPFRRWKLPAADDVEFHVTRHRDRRGDCVDAGHAFIIRISSHDIATLDDLTETMAHEMVHIQQDRLSPNEQSPHGKLFKRLAKQVCRYHGFEEAIF